MQNSVSSFYSRLISSSFLKKKYMKKDVPLPGTYYIYNIDYSYSIDEQKRLVYDILNDKAIFQLSSLKLKSENYREVTLEDKYLALFTSELIHSYKIMLVVLDNKDIFQGQILAFVLQPEISRHTFPNHPHINGALFNLTYNVKNLGSSICYSDKPTIPGESVSEGIERVMFAVSEWLFRNSIWERSTKICSEPIWIGPEIPVVFEASSYSSFLDPDNICFCGKNIPFKDCCSSYNGNVELTNNYREKYKEYILYVRSAINYIMEELEDTI